MTPIPRSRSGSVLVPEPMAARVLARLASGQGPNLYPALINDSDDLSLVRWPDQPRATTLEEALSLHGDSFLDGEGLFWPDVSVQANGSVRWMPWQNRGNDRQVTFFREGDLVRVEWHSSAPSRFLDLLLGEVIAYAQAQ